MRLAVQDAGGALLRRDDSFEPVQDATAAAGAALPAGGGDGPGRASPPGAERRELLLRIFTDSDHFWLSHGSLAASYVVEWLEALLHRQRQGADAAAAAGEAWSAALAVPEGAGPTVPAAAAPHMQHSEAAAAAGAGQPTAAMPAGLAQAQPAPAAAPDDSAEAATSRVVAREAALSAGAGEFAAAAQGPPPEGSVPAPEAAV